MKTYSLCVLGCKVNECEANSLKNKLDNSYEQVEFGKPSDITIIYTCCVTNTAESKTRKMIHKARRVSPNSFLVVIGCLVQIKKENIDETNIDLLIGSNYKDKVYDYIVTETRGCFVKEDIGKDYEQLEIETPLKTRAFLKIQDGCNRYCSYCIIPYTRGRERSADFNSTIESAKTLSKTSKELVLTGINTGRYNSNGHNLYDLLVELNKIDDLKNIRLSSIEINEVTDDIIDLINSSDKFGLNLHVPCQSLNDDILKLMHRPYNYEIYFNRIKYIKSKIPNVSISTDLIVGFPNETDEIFEDIINKIKEINFSFIHVFPFASKKGTLADTYPNKIKGDIQKYRVNKVIDTQKDISLNYHSNFLNKNVDVLIEKSVDGYSYGYSKYYFYVKVKGIYESGEIIPVKITSVGSEEVEGEYAS